MATIDLDSAAEGVTLGSVDVILGDIFEWGGITSILKLRGACETDDKFRMAMSVAELFHQLQRVLKI